MPGRKMRSGLIPTFESSQVGDSCDPAAQLWIWRWRNVKEKPIQLQPILLDSRVWQRKISQNYLLSAKMCSERCRESPNQTRAVLTMFLDIFSSEGWWFQLEEKQLSIWQAENHSHLYSFADSHSWYAPFSSRSIWIFAALRRHTNVRQPSPEMVNVHKIDCKL